MASSTILSVALFIYAFRGIIWLIAGIVLMVLWWGRVKNTTALFHDKRKIRATLFLFLPGLACLIWFAYIRFIYTPSYNDYSGDYSYTPQEEYIPTMAKLWIANYSDKPGRIKVGKDEFKVGPGSADELDIKSKLDRDTLRGWLGDSLVIDTIITGGSWIGNFSEDITVEAEEVLYSEYSYTSTEDLGYNLLSGAGIEQFTSSTYPDVYGFESTAPSSITVTAGSVVRKWDVSTRTDEQLMKDLMDALGKVSGDEDEE